MRRLPRGIFALYMRCGGDFGLMFAVVAAIAFGFAIYTTAQEGRFAREGVPITAEIVGKRIETGIDGRTGAERRHYLIAVRFQPEGRAAPVEVEHDVSRRFYESVGRGTVGILYLPDDPEVVQIEPARLARYRGTALITGTVAIVFTLWHTKIVLGRGLPALRVRDTGRTTTGTVIAFDESRNGGCWRIDFTDDAGRSRTAWTLPSPRYHHDGLEESARVRVHYDPDELSRAYWAGDVA